MSINQYLMFVVITSTFLMSPGPSVLLSISNGVRFGIRNSAIGVMGNVIAFQILMLLSAAGLGVVLTASSEIFNILKIAGAAYLIYLGVKIWRSPTVKRSAQFVENRDDSGPFNIFKHAFITTSSNPKALIYVSALLPQFINVQQSLLPQLVLLCSTSALIQFLIFMSYVAVGHKSSRWFENTKKLKLFNRMSGLTFIGFGVALGFSKNKI